MGLFDDMFRELDEELADSIFRATLLCWKESGAQP